MINKKEMTKEESVNLIKEIESIDLRTSEGQEKFNSIIETRVIRGGAFKLTINPHSNLYYVRARIINEKDDYFRTIDDHSYNKKYPQYIKRGRANFPEQAIFYAGRNRITALAEVNIIDNKKEEKIVAYGISRWVINKPINLIAILNPDTIDQINCGELNGFIDFVKDTYNKQIGTQNEGIIEFYKFLSEKFTERIVDGEEHKYIITSTIANQIFNKLPDVGGLLYQSVKWPDTYNLALKPEYIDEEFIIPSHFFKETFVRKNVIDLKEVKMEQAKSFDKEKNLVEW